MSFIAIFNFKKFVLPLVFIIWVGGFSDLKAQQYTVDRVEPLNWWVGMENPRLQIVMHGENIGALKPTIDYQGIEIERIKKVENPNYLFIYLNISDTAKAGTVEIVLTSNDQKKIVQPYQLKTRETQSVAREGFNSSDVIYLITPDRFANGSPENDTVKGYADSLNRTDDYGRHGGDIQGIIDHLDYIQEMGFTAIWLNPVLENAMPESSYHGYATTDYYKVDPRFGSNELYKELSDEAEKRGIKLIMDMITNHAGSNHWWMKDPPSSNWIHYQDDFKITNHRRTVLHDPYAAEIDSQQFTNGWFVETMPDLNQSNPLLADYLIYNSLWWIEYAGLRGIRHDTHSYAGQKFMQKWTCRIMEEYPNFNIVGEEWSPDPLTIAKWQRGSRLLENFDSCLPSLMDFPMQQSLIASLNEEESWGSGFVKLYENLSYDFLYPDPFNLVIFADNHDMDRFFRQVNEDYDLFKMGIVYLATMRGIPQIYYGTEILKSNKDAGDHGQIREDIPGGWPADTANTFTGNGLTEKQQGAQQFVKKLLNWRKNNPVIHDGKLMQYAPKHDGIHVYFRYNKTETVMVIFNKNRESKSLEAGYYRERLSNFIKGTDLITGQSYSFDKLKIPARSSLVLELE